MPKSQSPTSQRIESFLDFDKRVFFLILVILFLTVRIITNDIIIKSIPGYEELEADGAFSYMHIFNTLNYIWTPFSLLWKFTLTAFVIWTGAFTFGYKVSFKVLWKYVMVAELVFLFPEIIRMLIFISPSENTSYLEIKNFYPLSLYQLFDQDAIADKYRYPLQALNLFEFLYIILLILGFHTISNRPIKASTFVIIGSYLVVFLLWLLFYIMVYRN
ncbi:MAG: sulfate ABC transporter permease [Mongoliibacter sp.]|uniref:sulfate ABC transporter permease n=1 Tax=Mongoliibacter sp. TaxID=2022438 RepID=UPI0012F25D99|nr:sulfate ABC transporter permease [Mongoliibacter sp.]TVP46121.1 MAG: sulfate ABC transporter permease [Mongoliibacter sp.]